MLTGRLLWRTDARSVEIRAAEVKFDASPLIRGDRLLIAGRRRRSFGFEDCYLYGFNARDGRLEYRVHLGSASTATLGSRATTTAIAALHDDTAYVCSGLGSIAAVSIYS